MNHVLNIYLRNNTKYQGHRLVDIRYSKCMTLIKRYYTIYGNVYIFVYKDLLYHCRVGIK